MAFDVKAFMKQTFIPREGEVEIHEPELKKFFNSDEKAVWVVRGLTGLELGRANAIAEKSGDLQGIVEGILSRQSKAQAEAVRKMMGQADDVPVDVAKRIEYLMIGSVKPKVDLEFAVKIRDAFPIEFYQLTTQITQLTGSGHVPGKPKPSGKTKKSSSR